MTLKIIRVEPTTQVAASGKKKYYAYDESGDRHIAWGDWVLDAKDKEIDATVKKETYKGNDYTVIWPAKESAAKAPSPVASEVAIRERTRILAEPEVTSTELPSPTSGKLSQAYWERRDRMVAKESALKSAAEVWSTKLSVGMEEAEKTSPLDMAKEFYSWITSDR